jgi:GxxExxY protein
MKSTALKRSDLVYPELCYQTIGVLFSVYNELGYGHKEKIYQKAVAEAFRECGLKFREQLYAPVIFRGKNIGKNYFDFLIDDKLVLEIKRDDYFHKSHIEQLYNYLVVKDLKLGLLIYFTPRNLHFKRVVNIANS